MMKNLKKYLKRILFIGITAIFTQSNAQVVIDSSDFYPIGFKGLLKYDSTTTMLNIPTSGTNLVWDFSNILNQKQGELGVLDIISAPQNSKSVESNMAFYYIENIDTSWGYFDLRSDGVYGVYDLAGISDSNEVFKDADYGFPMFYGQELELVSEHIVYKDSIKQVYSDTTYFIGMGEGSLITPDDTFDSVVQVLVGTDQYVTEYKLISGNWVYNRDYTYYVSPRVEYYSKGGSFIPLSHNIIDTAAGISATEIGWVTTNITTSLKEHSQNNNKINIYPTPTSNLINIEVKDLDASIETYTIMNTAGKVVMSGVFNKVIDLSSISSGVYVLQLHTKKQILSKRIIRE